MEPIYLTQKGLDNLIVEFKDLVEVKRPEVSSGNQAERDLGDVAEKAE